MDDRCELGAQALVLLPEHQRSTRVRGRPRRRKVTVTLDEAHVVVCARRAHQRVVTSDPDDLRRLDPTLEVLGV